MRAFAFIMDLLHISLSLDWSFLFIKLFLGHICGFLTGSFFCGVRLSTHAQPPSWRNRSHIYNSLDWVTQLCPQALGTHFSRLLQYAWATVELFFNPGYHTGNYARLIDWLVCFLSAGPVLWKRMPLKCSITMVFTCHLLSSSPFWKYNNVVVFPFPSRIFMPLANLWLVRLQG